MGEPRTFEDEATLYVLGELGPIQRRRFEARLKTSPQLRILVRELEAGSVALTLAVPQRQPPVPMWDRIHDAVESEKEKAAPRSFLSALLRGGWAAAACIMLGWLIYALWVNHSGSSEVSSANSSSEASQNEPEARHFVQAEAPPLLPQPQSPTNVAPAKTPLAQRGEIAVLRREIRDLEDQVALMSQALTQQQTFPSSPGQLAFFDLIPTPADGASARVVKPPSPELQRALLIGMARELGWLRPSAASSLAHAERLVDPESQKPGKETEKGEAPDLGVKFVDLPAEPGGQMTAAPPIGKEEAEKLRSILAETPVSPAETPSVGSPEIATAAESSIPAFRSGNNLVLAIDSSIVPSARTSPVTVWTGARLYAAPNSPPIASSPLVPFGTFTIGNSPTVLTIPLGNPNGAPGTVVFTVGGTPNGPLASPGVIRFSTSP